ncbi:MAG: zf-TFIIB domain-containing protein [Burkholderiales bacterium]|nr:zf-TFIIB domain-containing protein [Burkholderiales bacterium]
MNNGTTDCPNCAQPMENRRFDRHLNGAVAIDLCFPCHVIWFDQAESLQLAPEGVIELFKAINGRGKAERRPLEGRLDCPRCRGLLQRTSDFSKSGHFLYFRCVAGHGRLTPFFQFLREKQFVRSLNDAELARVRAEIRQVQCSSCGAPIDLERDTQCSHCGAPVAVLDADAVEKAVRMYAAAAAKLSPDPATVARAFREMEAQGQRARVADHPSWLDRADGVFTGADLLDGCIDLVAGFFR